MRSLWPRSIRVWDLRTGAWYTYEGDQLGQGKENARNFLRDNPDMANEIEKKIKEKLGIGPRLDAEAADGAPASGPGLRAVPSVARTRWQPRVAYGLPPSPAGPHPARNRPCRAGRGPGLREEQPPGSGVTPRAPAEPPPARHP